MLTPRFSSAQAVASLGPKRGGTGFGKDESYTPITEKSTVSLLKSILHSCAETPEALTFSTRAEQKARRSSKMQKRRAEEVKGYVARLRYSGSPKVTLLQRFNHTTLPVVAKGSVGPFGCNLN